MLTRRLLMYLLLVGIIGCDSSKNIQSPQPATHAFTWDNATVYFLLTDRFNNGNNKNDYQHTEDNRPAPFRGYMGGDIKGITEKIKEGYFTDLGVNAIWMTPLVEQIDGSVDEGTGNSFGFHGYWTRDWTALEPNFGSPDELKELVATAHENDLRIIIDVVANHTGPVTELDAVWPDEWVKTGPRCVYEDYETTVNCTLVENLPDIKTESVEEVTLPPFLVEKWKNEGRYDQEVAELDNWFETTGYPRTPVNYILKWLVDFIKEYGVDGFRVDTVKHTESDVWSRLFAQAVIAWETYKKENGDAIIDPETPFYMVGEVYNYYISGGQEFDYGDKKVNFYKDGFNALINFDFKTDAHNSYEEIFKKYDGLLQGELHGKTVLNYISSHDDGGPYDLKRERPIEAGTKLLLCPGGVQIYYGDETARTLTVEADGDATLRSFMNWDDIIEGSETKKILDHWRKLGQFRNNHPSIGAGKHAQIASSPYTFTRKSKKYRDSVVVALDTDIGTKKILVEGVFNDGDMVVDAYTGTTAKVKGNMVTLDTPATIVLLEKA